MTTRSEDIWMCTECCALQGRHDQWFTGDICEKCNEKMENTIPIAEEFLKDFELGKTGKVDIEDAKQALIEFAKLHVEAALKGCLNKYHHASEENYDFGSSEIMNSYPLSNIK